MLAAALAILAGPATAARADDPLDVKVTGVNADRLELVAAVPGASVARPPKITVTRDGILYPAGVRVGVAAPANARPRALVVVLDASTAMAGKRLSAAQDGLLGFVDAVPADVAVGLVTTGSKPVVAVKPMANRAAFRAAVQAVRANGAPAIYQAVESAAALVKNADLRLLVVAGDRDTDSRAGSVAEALVGAGHPLDIVTTGAASAGLVPLRNAAGATGGTWWPAETSGALTEALRTVPAPAPYVAITVPVPAELAGTAANLLVTAATAAGPASGSVDVQFPSSSGPATVANTGPPLALHLSPSLLAVLLFAALLLAALLVTFGIGGSGRDRRLRQVEQFRQAARGVRVTGRVREQPTGAVGATVRGLSDRMVQAGGGEERVATRLDKAGIALRPQQWVTVRLGAMAAGAALLGLLLGLIGILLGALVGWLLANLYPRLLEQRRRDTFADQLPDSLQLVVGSLRSGFSLAQALDAVVRDSPPGPLTTELSRALGEVRLGADLTDALQRAAERVGNDDLSWVVVAMRIQREAGGNLAEILETTVETIRERGRLRRHVRALSAEGRLSAYMLISLPIILVIYLYTVNRAYISVLWTTPLGLMMSVTAIVLLVVGWFWMSRWMKVEV
jgi:tight adherence protein B